jgi:RNA polymerase sigma-70 factor, ECF subfamily
VTPTLEEVWAEHGARLLGHCRRLTRDGDQAEDLRQDVFLHLHRALPRFRGESALGTWLHSVTLNVYLMKRRRKRLPLRSLDAMAEDDAAGAGSLDRALASRDAELDATPERVALQRAVARMPAGQRRVLELAARGLEHREVAALLGVNAGTSKSQLAKARRWLARELGGEHAPLRAPSGSVGTREPEEDR